MFTSIDIICAVMLYLMSYGYHCFKRCCSIVDFALSALPVTTKEFNIDIFCKKLVGSMFFEGSHALMVIIVSKDVVLLILLYLYVTTMEFNIDMFCKKPAGSMYFEGGLVSHTCWTGSHVGHPLYDMFQIYMGVGCLLLSIDTDSFFIHIHPWYLQKCKL